MELSNVQHFIHTCKKMDTTQHSFKSCTNKLECDFQQVYLDTVVVLLASMCLHQMLIKKSIGRYNTKDMHKEITNNEALFASSSYKMDQNATNRFEATIISTNTRNKATTNKPNNAKRRQQQIQNNKQRTNTNIVVMLQASPSLKRFDNKVMFITSFNFMHRCDLHVTWGLLESLFHKRFPSKLGFVKNL